MTSRELKDIEGDPRRVRVYDSGLTGWIGLMIHDGSSFGLKGAVVSPAELAEALNEIVPGFKASYEPPRPKNVDVVRELPVGSVFRWSDSLTGYAYVKTGEDAYRSTHPEMQNVIEPKHLDHGDGRYHVEVIYRPES